MVGWRPLVLRIAIDDRLLVTLLCATALMSCTGYPGGTGPAPPKGGASTAATEDALEEYRLPNGVTVLIQPRHSVPVVALNVWVHVGSKDEGDATRGLAHIQEHMLFQETTSYSQSEIFKTVESVGGDINAFTNSDVTVYHITMPREGFTTGLEILGSMMHEATIPEEALRKELEVVMEEFRRMEDTPRRVLRRHFYRTAYTEHPYRHPVIGNRETIAGTTRDQVLRFYQEWYVPENLTLVIVGDVDAAAIRSEVERTFGAIPTRPNPKRTIPPDPPQQELRTVVARGPFENTSMTLGFRNTALIDEDTPTLDLLYAILGEGRSSRLVRTVREERKLVTNISTASETPEHPGLGRIEADLAAINVASALEAILQEVARLRTEPVTEEELARAKRQIEAEVVYEKESYQGQARKFGFFEVLAGDPEGEETYLKGIWSATVQEILAAAQRYLQSKQLTIGVLYPEGETTALTEGEIQGIVAATFTDGSTAEGGATISPIASRTDDAEHDVTKVTFHNGMTLLVREDHSVPILALHAVFVGGLRTESAATNGVNHVFSHMITRGTLLRSQTEIAEIIEGMGATFAGYAGRNSFGLTGKSLSREREPFLDLLAEVLRESTFPADQLELVRGILLDSIRRRRDSPSALAFDSFTAALYGHHPYGLPTLGTEESMGSLTRDDLMAFVVGAMVPQNLVLAIVGNIEVDEVVDQIDRTLGAWRGPKNVHEPSPPPPTFPTARREVRLPRPKQQTQIVLGFPGIPLDHPDRHALDVTDKILSGPGGRLFLELRDKQSLAYQVGGLRADGFRDPGLYAVTLGCEPSKEGAAIAGIRTELQKLRKEVVSAEELQRAIDYLVGSFVVDLQTFEAQASTLAFAERYGLGYDDYTRYAENIRRVTAEDVQRIAQQYLTIDRATLAIVGPE